MVSYYTALLYARAKAVRMRSKKIMASKKTRDDEDLGSSHKYIGTYIYLSQVMTDKVGKVKKYLHTYRKYAHTRIVWYK